MDIIPAEANVTDELLNAGIAFGDLVLTTGQAVAETQNKLNATSASSASALATTTVDVIAVQEKIYDDQGNIENMVTHTRKLPLINFIDPVFYEWTSVRLQGQFYANELVAASSSQRYQSTSKKKSGQGGFFVLLGGGRTTLDISSTTTDFATDSTQDISYGRVRMNAMLRPRADIGVPKPTQVLRGPRLSISEGEISDIMDGSLLTARTMSLLIQYNLRNGNPIENKTISIETDGVSWEYAGVATTDTDGQVEILLRRTFLDEEADTSPVSFVVSARKGMVQNSVTVTF